MDLRLINERRHNSLYTDGGFTYKIFNSDYEKKDVFQEAFITSKIEELNINVPAMNSIYKTDDKWTIKFEFFGGESLYSIMKKDPGNITKYIEQMVDIQTNIHLNLCTAIPRQKAKLLHGIKSTNLDESFKLDLIDMLDSSPKHKKLCHGNFTPHNVIFENNEYYILDWNHASQGNASADVARTYIWFKINMPEYADTYLEAFCNKSNTSMRYVNQWLPIVAAARLAKDNPEEIEALTSMIKLMEY